MLDAMIEKSWVSQVATADEGHDASVHGCWCYHRYMRRNVTSHISMMLPTYMLRTIDSIYLLSIMLPVVGMLGVPMIWFQSKCDFDHADLIVWHRPQIALDTVPLYHIMTAINLPAASATKAPRIAAAFRCWRGVYSFHLASIASAIICPLVPMNMIRYLPHPRSTVCNV